MTDIATQQVNEDVAPDHFPVTPKDISHVTLYFDLTPGDGEDDAFFFVKIETPDSVDDDFDHWYQAALEEVIARDAALADAKFVGAALKYGREEAFFSLDGKNYDDDSAPTGGLVQAKHYGRYEGGTEYSYGDLF
jgi:hypothetical protein